MLQYDSTAKTTSCAKGIWGSQKINGQVEPYASVETMKYLSLDQGFGEQQVYKTETSIFSGQCTKQTQTPISPLRKMATFKLLISLGLVLLSAKFSSSILCLCVWTSKVNTFCCLGLHKCCPTPPPPTAPPQINAHYYYGGSYPYHAGGYVTGGAGGGGRSGDLPIGMVARPVGSGGGGQSGDLPIGMVAKPVGAPEPLESNKGQIGDEDYYKFLYGAADNPQPKHD